ncbi:hypothetical protein PENNAL_c0103G05321 [Penicillium nalgiovense]|uniref:Uncharacterized protein n=1 Tax=Penicillium nalgiovense TaxID=60175 RepID=A0A1V6X958_PENNA|nr:hypothetical protein PENNAL_c0103G05321 [Penicillium nalgiovense]
MTPTARRIRRQRVTSDYDLAPLLCDSSKLPPFKMATDHHTHASRNIRADPPSPPSSRQAKKILRVRIHHRSHGSHVTPLTGRPSKSQKKGTKTNPHQKRADSEREATRLDWIRRLRPMPHRLC